MPWIFFRSSFSFGALNRVFLALAFLGLAAGLGAARFLTTGLGLGFGFDFRSASDESQPVFVPAFEYAALKILPSYPTCLAAAAEIVFHFAGGAVPHRFA